jgi:hypothetical protein
VVAAQDPQPSRRVPAATGGLDPLAEVGRQSIRRKTLRAAIHGPSSSRERRWTISSTVVRRWRVSSS